MTPVALPKPKLPEWMRDQIRLRQCSIRKEIQYLQWVKRFILFHDKRHPVDMWAVGVISQSQLSEIFWYDLFLAVTGFRKHLIIKQSAFCMNVRRFFQFRHILHRIINDFQQIHAF